jgi:RNA polymerase sigma factor (sigma-70 family)
MRWCVPISPDYGDLFSDDEVAIAHKLIREFRNRWTALQRNYDHEDLLQEIALHWYEKRKEYDPAKEASIKTYCATIIRNKLLDLVRASSTDKRKISHYVVEESGENLTSLIDRYAVIEPRLSVPADDLSKALQKLTPKQQKFCQLLMQGINKSEAARKLGINRRTVYDYIARIRKVFIKEGLGHVYAKIFEKR